MESFILAIICIGAVLLAIAFASAQAAEKKRVEALSPAKRTRYMEEKKEAGLTMLHGPINSVLICPHCQEKGRVRTKAVQRKKGVSGGKATAAILTGGVSMLATGLSRKEQMTEAYCGSCTSRWEF